MILDEKESVACMTTVTIQRTSNGMYKGVTTFGHAEYGRHGEDIVCASISILLITTLNFIEEKLHIPVKQVSNDDTGFTDTVSLADLSTEGKAVMDSMIYGLQMIEQQYGKKYLALKFEEV